MKNSNVHEQIVLGVDPGYAIVGYGVVGVCGNRLSHKGHGVLLTEADMSFPDRLERVYMGLKAVIDEYTPDSIAFEELFFARNTKTALQVSAARGVALLAAKQSCLPLYEYTPMQIKLAVTGNGHADKHQVQTMIKLLLGLDAIPKPDDAADALAAAICHGGLLGAASREFLIK